MSNWIRSGLLTLIVGAAALTGCAGADRDGDPADEGATDEGAIRVTKTMRSCDRIGDTQIFYAPNTKVSSTNDTLTIHLPFQFEDHTGPGGFRFHVQTILRDGPGAEVQARFKNHRGEILKSASLSYYSEFEVTHADVPPEATSYTLELVFYGQEAERAEINWSAECTLS